MAACSPRSRTAGRRSLIMLRTLLMVASIWCSAYAAFSLSLGCVAAVRACSIDASMRNASRFCTSSSWISRAMRLRSSWAAVDQRCGFEAIHDRHLDVQQHHGEILLQQHAQCLAPGGNGGDIQAHPVNDGADRLELRWTVVDDQNGCRNAVRRQRLP